jgi:hypothetical protein
MLINIVLITFEIGGDGSDRLKSGILGVGGLHGKLILTGGWG